MQGIISGARGFQTQESASQLSLPLATPIPSSASVSLSVKGKGQIRSPLSVILRLGF